MPIVWEYVLIIRDMNNKTENEIPSTPHLVGKNL